MATKQRRGRVFDTSDVLHDEFGVPLTDETGNLLTDGSR